MTDRRRGDAERFRTMVESSTEGVCTLDAEDRLAFLNPRMAEMLAAGDEDLTGTPVARLVREQDGAGLADALAASRAGRREGHELWLARRDAGTLPVIVSATALSEATGSGTLMMVTDISARVAAEQERAQLHDLQRLEGLSRLAGGIGHEFNNLMGVILNYASLVDAELAGRPDLQADLGEITTAARRSAHLTRQLLTFSRQDVPVLGPLDLGALVGGAEHMLQPALPPRVAVSISVPTEPAVVCADRHQMERVLLNLAINAGDAMPDGGRLALELEAPAGDPWVTLSVRDHGKGMSPETLQRAIEPFFTTKQDPVSAGLGLASVYGIVGEHGGRVGIESREGHGTTVTIHLPAVPPAEPAAEAPPLPPQTLVLLVEDEPAVRQVTARLLAAAGMSVIACSDPKSALARPELEDGTVDVLLTDIRLPGMSGHRLAQRVRARLPGLAVVFMSGYADDPQARAAMQGASVAFVGKPFSGAELTDGVRRALAAAALS